MADVDHPKTHVEDQHLEEPRKQPESPKHEGIDPLTESDTMYPAENVQDASRRLARKEEKAAAEAAESDTADEDTTVSDQEERTARINNAPSKDAGDDNAEVRSDKTDKETGTENTSASNKTTDTTAQADVKAAEKKTSTKTPKA